MANEQNTQTKLAPTETKKRVGFCYPTGAHHTIIIGQLERGGLRIPEQVQFEYGLYATENPEIIAKLRKHSSNVVNGREGKEAYREMNDMELMTYTNLQATGNMPSRLWNEQIGLVNGTRQYQRPTE